MMRAFAGGTTVEIPSGLRTVFKDGLVVKDGKYITAGNAIQLCDGAAAQLMMEHAAAEEEGKEILGIYRGFQAASREPEEMCIGPASAICKLLKRAGLTVDDIGLC